MQPILQQLENMGLVPVVKIDRAQDALPLAKALCDGGLPCAEVTFRTAAAADAIRAMVGGYPDMLIGAGTILSPEQADEAMAAGARFLVSPGFNPRVVAHCLEKGYPMVPGVATPSDIEQALEMGLDVLKFFPAENAGGLPMVKAMSAPYGHVRFMPTGGINADNLISYLEFPKIVACGGSWMVKAEFINAGDFDTIRRLTQQAMERMLGFTVAHIGINQPDKFAAQETADTFSSLFGFAQQEGEVSFWTGDSLEVMKLKGRGTKGHLAIRTNFLPRAFAYLQRKGVEFSMDTAQYDDKGQLKFIYLAKEVGGFAVHLVQK